MADDPNPNPNPETRDDGISEDELRGLIGTAVDEKLNERGLTKETVESLGGIGAFVEGLFEKNKSEPLDRDSLLGDIAKMVDEKLKGVSSGGTSDGGNGKPGRTPKLKIFTD